MHNERNCKEHNDHPLEGVCIDCKNGVFLICDKCLSEGNHKRHNYLTFDQVKQKLGYLI